MEINITSSATGWFAFGIGSGMRGADIMIAWIDATTQIGHVSDHTGLGYVQPAFDKQQDWTVVQSSISSTQRSVVARRLLITGDNTDQPFQSGVGSYIYAFSDQAVTGAASANQVFTQHQPGNRGIFQMDLFDASATGSSTASAYSKMFLVHGILMFLAWAVFSFAGIFVARFMKVILGVWWFRLHAGLLSGTGILTIIAFSIAVVQLGAEFNQLHHFLGLITTIIMVLQIILGKVIDSLWSPKRSETPIWDKIHWWTGRLLAVLSIITIFTGLLAFQSPTSVLSIFWVWVALVLGAFVYGQKHYGQSHHPVPNAVELVER